MKVRPAALKNEEAQKAREQHAGNRAVTAPVGYGALLLHVFYYYAFTPPLSTWSRSSAAFPTAQRLRCVMPSACGSGTLGTVAAA